MCRGVAVTVTTLAIISAFFCFAAVRADAAEDVYPPFCELQDQDGKAISSTIDLAPGEQKQLILVVKNPGPKAKINVKVNNLQTTDDGTASDMVAQNRLLPQAVSAADVFKGDDLGNAFLLAPGQQKRVPITTIAPTTIYTGKQSYVVVVAAAPMDELSRDVSMVTSVRVNLTNSPEPLPKAVLKFSEIKAADYFGRIGFVITVKNPFGNDVNASSLVAQVYSSKEGGIVATRALRPISVAPFSYFTFFVPVQSLTAQDYRVRISVVQKGHTKQKNFVVPVEQTVGGSVSQTAMMRSQWIQKIAIVLFVVGPVSIIGMQIIQQRHRSGIRFRRRVR